MRTHLNPILLEKYLDKELSGSLLTETEQHLETCPECQNRLEELRQLNRLLVRVKPPVPSQAYLEESLSIIQARTIALQEPTYPEKRPIISDFIRSIVAVAASLLLLLSAIYLGSDSQVQQYTQSTPDNQMLVIAPAYFKNAEQSQPLYVQHDQIRQLKGMLLIGPPGALGRFGTLYQFSDFMQ